MAIIQENNKSSSSSPHPPIRKPFFLTQIALRVFALSATLAAAWLIVTSKQTTTIFGIAASARYYYSPAFKFFAFANVIAFAFSLLSLIVAWILGRSTTPVHPSFFFYLFIHDLIVGSLLLSGCAAATAVGYVGKYGNSRIGWMAICDHFGKFCSRLGLSVGCSYLGFFFYLILTVMSARRSMRAE